MSMNEIIKHCLSYPDSFEDHPFGEGWTAIRHRENKKIFALIFNLNGHLCVNLKCDPDYAGTLRNTFADVQPGYHMNKDHWNTVILDGDLPKAEIYDMVKHSFEITKPKSKKVFK